jgi:ABC-type transporter Mla MlaB component
MDEILVTNRRVKLLLAGAFVSEYVPEARTQLEAFQEKGVSVTLDLSQLRHIDRDGIGLLVWATQSGTGVINPPSYVLRWIKQECVRAHSQCD